MVEQVIVAWSRQSKLTDGEHLLDGYFDLKGEDFSTRSPFKDLTYAKAMGKFARIARDNTGAKLLVLRLDQTPEPVAMPLDPTMADLLRKDPAMYIRSTSPPARVVKVREQEDPLSKIQENIHEDLEHGEPWHKAPIPGGYATVAECFSDDIYCRVSGKLVECPHCGRWAAMSDAEQEDERHVVCTSCLFEDIFRVVTTPKQTWAVIPTEALLQNEKAFSGRLFIPRLWNKGGPWIKRDELKQKYETFCKERQDASERNETSGSDAS